MKVLLVQDYGAALGGAEIMLHTLRDGLCERGYDARIFVSDAGLRDSVAGIDYTCLGTLSRFRTLLQTANPWAVARLREALREFRPDVVHVRMYQTQLSPLILPLLRDVPTIYHVQWYRSICPVGTKLLPNGHPCEVAQGIACLRNRCLPAHDWALLTLQSALARRWESAIDSIVAVSESARRHVEAAGYRVDAVVWNGVPESASVADASAEPLVGYAGRLVPEKGVDVLVRAFAKVAAEVPRARLLVLGDGPQRPVLERLVGKLGLGDCVELAGHVDRGEVERALGRAWVQVVPSLWDEPFGLVTAEALMRGTPLVATSVGGALEMVRDGETGLLVAPGDDEALAGAIGRLLGDKDLAGRLGSTGREYARHNLTVSACVDQFVAIYEKLLRRAGHD